MARKPEHWQPSLMQRLRALQQKVWGCKFHNPKTTARCYDPHCTGCKSANVLRAKVVRWMTERGIYQEDVAC